MREFLDRRQLGAIRCVDAITGAELSDGVVLKSPQLELVSNRRGLWVIVRLSRATALEQPALADFEFAFEEQPTTVAEGSLSATVEAHGRNYLGRSISIDLPRSADPNTAGSVYDPISIALFPSPQRPPIASWAVVRTRVEATDSGSGLAGAVLARRTTPSGELVLAGMSDARGEALVAVPDLPLVSSSLNGTGSPVSHEIEFEIVALHDENPARVPIDPDEVLRRHRATSLPASERRPQSNSASIALSPGTEKALVLSITSGSGP